ncbi:uncharacterized protein LOC107876503 [Capsicum annuum]|uniref:uncharacterized protein LOC107876503 n=1 Tax=Capsicum annuum TaxID=4072 RepID=UPI0007BF139C|nr:uncharacterized protein LOC107876503 [Capsicum annuum]
MLGYAKYIKDLVMKKRVVSYESVDNLHHYSVISARSLVQKKADPRALTIPSTIGSLDFSKALHDLGASTNLMPLVIYKKLGLGDTTPTNMRLVMANKSVKQLVSILYDVLVKVDSFIFSAAFIILDFEVDFEVPIIMGQPFFATKSVLIDLQANELLFKINDEVVQFDVFQSMKQHKEISVFSIIDVYYKDGQEVLIEEKFSIEPLATVLMNFKGDGIEEYEEIIYTLTGMGSYSFAPKKLDLDLKNRLTQLAKLFIEEPPMLELKELQGHLCYVFLGSRNTPLVIIAVDLGEKKVEALIFVLQRYKWAIG